MSPFGFQVSEDGHKAIIGNSSILELVWPVDTEMACVVGKAWPSFPHSSVGKECTCNAGDLSLILGLGISAGEGIGYPFQYSWASLVTQLVKNPPAMWEIQVRALV